MCEEEQISGGACVNRETQGSACISAVFLKCSDLNFQILQGGFSVERPWQHTIIFLSKIPASSQSNPRAVQSGIVWGPLPTSLPGAQSSGRLTLAAT